jgi:hypothetical protein
LGLGAKVVVLGEERVMLGLDPSISGRRRL